MDSGTPLLHEFGDRAFRIGDLEKFEIGPLLVQREGHEVGLDPLIRDRLDMIDAHLEKGKKLFQLGEVSDRDADVIELRHWEGNLAEVRGAREGLKKDEDHYPLLLYPIRLLGEMSKE